MTGRQVIEWIEENGAEEAEIYLEVSKALFKPSEGFEVLGSEDCPCFGMVVLK